MNGLLRMVGGTDGDGGIAPARSGATDISARPQRLRTCTIEPQNHWCFGDLVGARARRLRSHCAVRFCSPKILSEAKLTRVPRCPFRDRLPAPASVEPDESDHRRLGAHCGIGAPEVR